MAFVTRKTLFIHVQKTGGMTVRKALYLVDPMGRESGEAEGERHFGLPEVRASHPGIDTGRLTFGFVRNPIDWLASRWAFAVMTGFPAHVKHRRSAAATWMAACWADDFNRFAENYLERFPGAATQTMFRMLGLWSEKPADRIGRSETLLADLARILEEAGEPVDRARVNSLAPANVTVVKDKLTISTELRRRIIDAERSLVAKFYPDL